MNNVILTGNLATEPESRKTQSGISQCSFRLAVQRNYKNDNGTYDADFINIVCWRQLADTCAKYLAKGRKILVKGAIMTRNYEAQDGTKRYVTEIVADNIEFLGSNQRKADDADVPPEHGSDRFEPVDDDELPF